MEVAKGRENEMKELERPRMEEIASIREIV